MRKHAERGKIWKTKRMKKVEKSKRDKKETKENMLQREKNEKKNTREEKKKYKLSWLSFPFHPGTFESVLDLALGPCKVYM